ncbi:Hsp20/alpha crystallin family protein [Bacteroidia bacterium]|nr:Hsp20/alpha crystallin family protein [Bacteroidia bacterium]
MNIIKQPKMISDIFQSNFNNMLQDILIDQNIIDRDTATPKVNISGNEDNYQINVIMPGIDKEDITLSIDNDILTIQSNYDKQKDKDQNALRTEFIIKEYYRKISLPKDADHQSISANLKNGILEITIKKIKVKPKNIIVK